MNDYTPYAHGMHPEPIDFNNLRSYSEGDHAQECHFFKLFLGQHDEALDILRANCTDGESAHWRAAAHLIKGGAASVGALRLSLLASEAEADTIDTAEGRRAKLAALEAETKRIRAFLANQNLLLE